MDVKYQIFVSSTFEDLRVERSAVIEQILNLQHIPVGMESFNAADDTQWNYIKRRIDRSDYYLVIVAERYGSIEQSSGKSYTQKEYEYAVEQGKPVVAFLLDKASRASWPREKVEFDKQAQIEEFRKLCQGRIVRFWRNADHLGGLVSTSLSEIMQDRPGIGWVRGDSVPANALAEMTALVSDNRLLKDRLTQLEKSASNEFVIPADAVFRLEALSESFLLVQDRGGSKQIHQTTVTALAAFLYLHKSFSIGLGNFQMGHALRGSGIEVQDHQFLRADDAFAELSSNNLIVSRIEQGTGSSGGSVKVWYLTDFGKHFVLYAKVWLAEKKEAVEGTGSD